MTKQYQVLARKYRPKHFGELIGQDHVAKALANAIDAHRLHHAYLFTGTRGVGKTTIARILSKCLNCETGITSQPCGVCGTCQAIDRGQFIDLIEIDAASRTKVEDTRDLLENVPYAPVQGRYKVYLIDEVHMLSTHSFNALLKTLEEPPPHVKFLFATTDPQKLPVTIVSRCLQFVLRPLPQSLLANHLATILTQEQVAFDDVALWQLANSAKGSVRDALSLTDQAIAFGGGQIDHNTVLAMLGLIDSTDVLALLDDIYHNRRTKVAECISQLRQKQVDAPLIIEKLADSLHCMAMLQVLPDMPVDKNATEQQALSRLANIIDSTVLQLYYEIVIQAKDSLRLAATPMQALEMTILRLLAFRPLGMHEYVDVGKTDDNKVKNVADIDKVNDADVHVAKQNHLAQNTSQSQQSIDANVIDDVNEQITDEPSVHKQTINEQVIDEPIIDQQVIDEPKTVNPLSNQITTQAITPQIPPAPEALQPTQEITQDNAPPTTTEPPIAPNINNNDSDNGDENDNLAVADMGLEPSLALNLDDTDDNAVNNDNVIDDNVIDDNVINNNSNIADNTLSDDNSSDDTPNQDTNQTTPNSNSTPNYKIQALLAPPICEISGIWTQDKWDYWTYQAYHQGLLSNDEFALAQNAYITGDVAGACQLWVADIHHQINYSFANLKHKIKQALGADVQLTKSDEALIDTPHERHQQRHAAVVKNLQDEFASSPVVKRLAQLGFLADNTTPIAQTKLLL